MVAPTLWTAIAYFVAPLGVVVWLLLMSGFQALERASDLVVRLNVSLGGVNCTLPMFIAAFSTLVFAWEGFQLMNGGTHSSEAYQFKTDQVLAKRWRAERNLWIVAFNLLLWLTNWRVSNLLARIRAKSDAKRA
mmetsp:Transcript_7416/g.20018  ORF Transcript_7416/g.20018 Transcript_7416/m.20018 type:complete len:134 (-) Transcript_7416:64-465(-)